LGSATYLKIRILFEGKFKPGYGSNGQPPGPTGGAKKKLSNKRVKGRDERREKVSRKIFLEKEEDENKINWT